AESTRAAEVLAAVAEVSPMGPRCQDRRELAKIAKGPRGKRGRSSGLSALVALGVAGVRVACLLGRRPAARAARGPAPARDEPAGELGQETDDETTESSDAPASGRKRRPGGRAPLPEAIPRALPEARARTREHGATIAPTTPHTRGFRYLPRMSEFEGLPRFDLRTRAPARAEHVERWRQLCARSAGLEGPADEAAAQIVADVAARGDAAVVEYTARFEDRSLTPEEFELSPVRARNALEDLAPDLRLALE